MPGFQARTEPVLTRTFIAADNKLRLFDAHCHLQDTRIGGDVAVDAVLDAARAAGVQGFALKSTCEADWPRVLRLAARHPDVVPALGLHPWLLEGRSEGWLAALRSALEANPHAGVGECGLDKLRRGLGSGAALQEVILRQQLRLARELERPVTVHCVRSAGALLAILREEGPFPAGLLLHSWTGPAELLAPLAAIPGVHFSLSGHLTRQPLAKARAMAQQIPRDRLLLETDSPDGLPQLRHWQELQGTGGSGFSLVASAGRVQHSSEGSACTWDYIPLDWCYPLQTQATSATSFPDRGRVVSIPEADGWSVASARDLLNHPVNLRVVAYFVAALLECSVQEVSELATTNALRFYKMHDSA